MTTLACHFLSILTNFWKTIGGALATMPTLASRKENNSSSVLFILFHFVLALSWPAGDDGEGGVLRQASASVGVDVRLTMGPRELPHSQIKTIINFKNDHNSINSPWTSSSSSSPSFSSLPLSQSGSFYSRLLRTKRYPIAADLVTVSFSDGRTDGSWSSRLLMFMWTIEIKTQPTKVKHRRFHEQEWECLQSILNQSMEKSPNLYHFVRIR